MSMSAYFEVNGLLGIILFIMIVSILLMLTWDRLKWWGMNIKYSLPWIGKTDRLARDKSKDNSHPEWLKSERILCADYAKFIGVTSQSEFERYNSYLLKSGDLGRKPLSFFLWILILFLVVVEAIGFSYVLAGYTIPGASEAVQTHGAMGIAFLISVILVFLTHYSGHELYKNSKMIEARREWVEAGKLGKFIYSEISLANNNEDDDKPHYTQMAHRVGKKTSYMISVLTLVFVIIVAVGATYIRGVVLEKQLTEEVVGSQTSYFSNSISSNVPKDLSNEAKQVENDALNYSQHLDREGGWTTFIVLAVIFVFLQILGVILGYKYGFAGKQSYIAYKALGKGKYHTFEDVRQAIDQIVGTAQVKLDSLQQKIDEYNSQEGNEAVNLSKKTFRNFLEEQELERNDHYYKPTTQNRDDKNKKSEITAKDVVDEEQVLRTELEEIKRKNESFDEEAMLRAELEEIEKQKRIFELRRQVAQAKGDSQNVIS